MNQCMRITCMTAANRHDLHEFVQKYAGQFGLEGLVQPLTDQAVRVVVCGSHDAIEDFMDILHHGIIEQMLQRFEIEPFLKDRDYRGVFRVIE